MIQSFKCLFSDYHVFPYNNIREYPTLENFLRPNKLNAVTLGGGTLINSSGSLNNFIKIFQYYPDKPIFTFGSGVKNPHLWKRHHPGKTNYQTG